MKSSSLLHNLSYVNELIIISILMIILGFYFKKNVLKYSGIIFLFFLLFFFRNNTGSIVKNRQFFISPSSSKVTKIENKENENIVYTYLSPLDKHFMIAPVDCTIIGIKHKPLIHSDAERLRITFKDINGNIFSLDQIVSKLGHGAWLLKFVYKNRCVVFKKIGDTLKQGERYGLIRFGSNMQYNLPKSYKILVKKNQKCKIGSIIAEM